jgi:hypothetical protein
MTLKIISQESDGLPKTDLFAAERISHKEFVLRPSNHPAETFEDIVDNSKPRYVISSLTNTNTSQNLRYSWVFLHGEDDDISPLLISAPAECYIMAGGKTIDTFKLDFID